MQPELPTPRNSPEQLPQQPDRQVEHQPSPTSPEVGPAKTPERPEQLSENAARVAEMTSGPATTAALPTVVPAPIVDPAADAPADDTPVVAADEDLIEKEWVDKAKAIINSTKDDPAERERAVAKLQADYLKKRYGKELGSEG